MWFCDLINTMMHNQGSLHCRFVFTVFKFPHLAILTIRLQAPSSSPLPSLLPPPPSSSVVSHTLPTLFCLSSYLFFPRLQPCVAALRGTLCCPQPLSAVLRVPLLWLHLFLSFSTTTTLYYPPLPTSWQVHTLCTTCLPSSLSVDPPPRLLLGTETRCRSSRLCVCLSVLDFCTWPSRNRAALSSIISQIKDAASLPSSAWCSACDRWII